MKICLDNYINLFNIKGEFLFKNTNNTKINYKKKKIIL